MKKEVILSPPFFHLHQLFGDKLFDISTFIPLVNEKLCGQLSHRGAALRFVPQDDELPYPEMYYEQRIYHHGLIATRSNWHDLFNAAMWCLFPQTKALVNAIHVDEMAEQQGSKRTWMRDILTHFDECGVALIVTDASHHEWLENHDWKSLFVDHQSCWGKTISPFIFGHATYEQLLEPYIGLTAKTLVFEVKPNFYNLSLSNRYECIDQLLAQKLLDIRAEGSGKPLKPLPILGVPGWYDGPQDAEFYANTRYFRPLRHAISET